MPYGDLVKQTAQRFASYQDLELHDTTIEEREEYEPLIDNGIVVYAGVDYEKILRQAETEADVIVWDGGNNDFPFYKSDLHIVLADPHRPGHELTYYPGETNVRMADVVIINKVQTADRRNIRVVRENVKAMNPKALIIEAASPDNAGRAGEGDGQARLGGGGRPHGDAWRDEVRGRADSRRGRRRDRRQC